MKMSPRPNINLTTVGKLSCIAQASVGFITDAAWSPDGAILAVAHGGGVSLWLNGFEPAPTRTIEHNAPVKAIAFSPDGAALATASSDMHVRLWSTVEDFVLVTLRGHHASVEGLAFSANGRLLASVSGDKTIRVVDMTDSIGSIVFNGHTGEVNSVAFGADDKILVSGGWDGTLRLWDIATRTERTAIQLNDWIRQIVPTPDRTAFAAACKDGTVQLFDFENGKQIASLTAHEGGVDSLAFSPDGSLLITGGRDNLIHVWDWRTQPATPLTTLSGHTKPVLALAFHPVGTLIVSGGGDNQVRLWSVVGAENT